MQSPLRRPGRRLLRPRGSPAGTTSGLRWKKSGTLAPLDEHQHDPEQQEDDGDHQRRPEAEPGVAGFGVGRVGEFDRVLDEQVEEDRAAERRADADEEEVLDAAQQLAPVVDRAGEAGEPDSRRRSSGRAPAIESKRMFFADDRQADVPDDRERAHQDRRDVRGQVARVDLAERCRASRRRGPSRASCARSAGSSSGSRPRPR